VQKFTRVTERTERDIIVVGASAGGVEALIGLASVLSPDLPAAVFVVLHTPPWGRSELPQILSRSGPLPASLAADSQPFAHGHIYVAPPDYHLLLDNKRTLLWRGPKENRTRPAINPLFRSAAATHGSRVTGVVLTGVLDDGSAGLWWIRRNGGAAVVQEPSEAAFPDMPENALKYVDSAYVCGISRIGPLLTQLAKGEEYFDQCIRRRA
jgi:two-component system chemotaxis response regulator CheB